MKTSELTGALLDYWTGRAAGWGTTVPPVVEFYDEQHGWRAYSPSTNWAQGGPLLEKVLNMDAGPGRYYALAAEGDVSIYLHGDHYGTYVEGDTPLEAICRAVVRSVFGDEVREVPAC